MGEDLADRTGLEDGRDRLEIAAALWAMLQVDQEDPGQEFGPTDAANGLGFCRAPRPGRRALNPARDLFGERSRSGFWKWGARQPK